MIKDKNFIWNMIGTTFNSFLSLFFLVIVTRINGIKVSGLFSFAFSIGTLLQPLTNYGGRIYQITDTKTEFSLSEYLGSRVVTSFAGVLISIILCLFYKIDFTGYALIILIMSIKIIETFSDVIYGELQKNSKLEYVGKSLFYKSCLSLLLFFLVNFIFKNIIISTIFIVLSNLIIYIFYDLNKVAETKKYKINFEILKKSKNIFISNFILLAVINMPKFIGRFYLNDIEYGYLGIVLMIPTVMLLITQFLTTPIMHDLTTAYKRNKLDVIKNISNKTIKHLFILTFVLALLAYSLGENVLGLMYGIDFTNYKFLFVVLIFSGLFNGVSSLYMNILTIFRKTSIQIWLLLITLISNICLTILLANKFEIKGVIIGLLITMIIETLLHFFTYKYYFNKRRKEIKS